MIKKILLILCCSFLVICCDWEPDFFVAKNVKEIRLTGLTDKPGFRLTIGYHETNNYKRYRQKSRKYSLDTIDYFSPGIDITLLTYNGGNPPRYMHKLTFEDNILTINIIYLGN